MTSDTKIGLLLGLVFIFVIAFLINGVPGVPMERVTNELTHNMAFSGTDTQRIGENVRQVGKHMATFLPHSASQGGFGFRGPGAGSLPDTSIIRSTAPIPSDLAKRVERVLGENRAQKQAEEVAKAQGLGDVTRSVPPRTYIVKPGDILDKIAVKWYGDREGNVQATRDRLYAANRHRLSSPNELQIGQELIIPLLKSAAPESLQRVTRAVGGVGDPRPHDRPKTEETSRRSYKVEDGDSLWKIAAKLLGDGNRYSDILRLNKSQLGNTDKVHPGMRLRLPSR
ncbi:MAG: LysM peptidoglycan-binding domain-containing protein [Planctomycetes bacterium]|nr:LysM peptidoglycan-binding domain-containing protein [Planctomycetota bacterium]